MAGKPVLQFCFSPHGDTDLSLKPIGDAITNAKSSVFYSIAFLSQIQAGPVRQAIDKPFAQPLLKTLQGVGYRLVDSSAEVDDAA